MRVAPGARRLALAAALLAVPALLLSPPAGALFLVAAGFSLWFLRDPERRVPPEGIVAPADGRVSVVRREGDRVRVGVYMGVTDVHVNRAPLGGVVRTIEHASGANRPAFSKDSDRNERVRIGFGTHEVTLVAGWFARRITPYVDEGDVLDRGDRLGHVAFGSRADVLLPPSVSRDDLRVETGDRVRAGETVIARAP